jgi:restriction endonuclease Mrr
MAIPDFQTIMLPLLEIAKDEKEHSHGEVSDALASRFELTDAEKKKYSPVEDRLDLITGWQGLGLISRRQGYREYWSWDIPHN